MRYQKVKMLVKEISSEFVTFVHPQPNPTRQTETMLKRSMTHGGSQIPVWKLCRDGIYVHPSFVKSYNLVVE